MVLENKVNKNHASLIIAFSLLTIIVSILAVYFYNLSRKEMLNQSYQELAAISKLKIKQITDWRYERIGEAEFISRSQQLSLLIKTFLQNTSDKNSLSALIKWIKPLKENHEYMDMVLIDLNNNVFPLFSNNREKLSLTDWETNRLVLATKKNSFTDFHFEDDTGYVHLGLLTPIFDYSQKDRKIIATLMLKIDPQKNLFPLIQIWPTLSKTAETLIIKKDGKNIVFLNELRHRKNTTLKLKLPTSSEMLPAAKASKGFVGFFVGYDYRGVSVLSDINRIDDSPWFMITKIDMDEILSPLRERTIWIILSAGVVLLFTGLIVFVSFKQQQVHNLKKQFQLEQEKQALQKHYEYLIKNANDIILLSDDFFEIIEVNDSALKVYGYTKEEFRKLTIVNIYAPETRKSIAYHRNLIDAQSGLIFETKHISKDGKIFDVEVSSKLIEVEGKKYYQNIIRDITEKKQYEKKILRHNRVYSVLSNVNQTIVRRRNREDLFRECCRIAIEDGQFKLAWIGLIDETTKKVNVVSKCGFDEGYLDNINITINGSATGLGPTGTAIKEGRYIVCNDIQTDDRMLPWRDKAIKRNYLSSSAFPLNLFEKPIGAINFYSTEKNFFDDEEIKLLEELAMDISYALEFIEEEEKKEKVEAALRENKAQLSFALEGTNDGLWDLNFITGEIYLSPRGCEILGYTAEELPIIVSTWNTIVHPDDLQETNNNLNAHIEGRESIYKVEQRLRMKSGDWKWILSRGKVVSKDENGKPVRIVGTHTDISERKAAEKEKLRLLNMLEKSLNEIYVFDVATLKFQYVNSGALRNLGFTLEQMKKLTPLDIKPEITADKFNALIQALIDGSKSQQIFQTIHRRADGSLYPVEVYLQLFEEGDEKVFLAVINDITERKKAEQQIIERDELLAEMGRIAQVGGWEFDAVTFKGTWTEEVARIHELDPNVETSVELGIGFYTSESRTIIEKAIKEALETGKPYDLELEMITAKNKKKWIRTIGHPVMEGNKVVKMRGSFQDITKIKLAEEKIKKMNEELEQRVAERTKQLEASNKELEAFSYSVSHDLRAPLRGINGFSNILLENYKSKLDDEAAELIGFITANTNKMGRLIDDLLEFSRLGRKELKKLEVNMYDLVRKISDELIEEAASKNIIFNLEKIPDAKADYSLIQQVLINLLSNAIKFSSKKETPTIEFGGKAEPEENIYWIKDNGVGFNTKYSDKLFRVFQRLHRDDEFEGTGVGLAIVKRIIDKHNGKIWAESNLGKGSAFYFTLPKE